MPMPGAPRWFLRCAMKRGVCWLRIVSAGRMPGSSDDPELATALDRLDHLLDELANQPGGLNMATLARLQNETNADGLLFEVRVLRSRLPGNSRPQPAVRKGARYEECACFSFRAVGGIGRLRP